MACAAPSAAVNVGGAEPKPGKRAPIRGICFDLFTLFDPRSVVAVAETVAPGRGSELCESWRSRQFQYGWLHALAGHYVDFRVVTREALVFAAREKQLALSDESLDRLVSAYSELAPWPDSAAQLRAWKSAGFELAPLANFAPSMLEPLIAQSGFSDVFDTLISTDAARAFKPDPRAYALGVSRLGLPREQLAFSAFGGWDAAGAKWFGYHSFWVNRLGVPEEELGVTPDGSGPSLVELARFIDAYNAQT